MKLRALAGAVVLVYLLAPGARAQAQVERYAVVVGNNRGAADEPRLRYAEDDADKIARVLRELGGFAPENMVLLRGENAETLRRALITVNDRIRTRPNPGARVMLLVFYSGHADATALHLGASTLDHAQLRQLVRGSAAAVRLLVVDACRSGALTRVKGGRDSPPFSIALDQTLPGEGAVFLTSSAANEDAQESDELKGSFFTHHLASGLLGAADTDGDGRVVLEEAYRYAYDSTLRSSSRTLAGLQHPTFQYDLRGQGQIVLTTLEPKGSERGFLAFPPGKTYLVMQGDRAGAVVAEVGAHDRTRRLNVRADRYFVRGRGPDYLLEGTVALGAGETRTLDDRSLERIDYARLVRKGSAEVRLAHGPQAGYQLRSPVNGSRFCHGLFAGYAFELRQVTVVPRLTACHSTFENPALEASADELGAQVTLAHAWDLPAVTVELGVALGASLLTQRFTAPQGDAPSRYSPAGQLGVSLGVVRDLPRGFYLLADVAAASYVYRERDAQDNTALTSKLAARTCVALGKRL